MIRGLLILFLALLPAMGRSAPTAPIQALCSSIEKKVRSLGQKIPECSTISWNHVRNSVAGHPLIWTVFGTEDKASMATKNTTLILCGIHGDELTPMHLCFDLIASMKEVTLEANDLVIIAPLVNPDSYLKPRPTRTNQHGVDINRNFPTLDWKKDALRLWKTKFHGDRRRYPGSRAMSEPEVVFQINLVKRYMPEKIIAVHSPLLMLDYDGPEYDGQGKLANDLLQQMSQKANGYKIREYDILPGSLGNWAGKERDISTYTLELPTSDPSKSDEYWRLLKDSSHLAIRANVKSPDTNPKKKLVDE